ncbi:MAG: hypothetical protein V4594_21010 [Bacteroidota bacterium]
MTQFYLCDDPKQGLPAGISAYIYSYFSLRFFAVIKRLGLGTPTKDIAYEGVTVMFYYQRKGEYEAGYYLLYVSDNIDDVDHFELLEVLHEAVHWYVSLPGKTLTDLEFGILKDYCPDLPHFQLFEDRKTGECLLNFALGAHAFESFEAARAFMHQELGIAKGIVYCDLPAVNMN